jgi:hypothetical protein
MLIRMKIGSYAGEVRDVAVPAARFLLASGGAALPEDEPVQVAEGFSPECDQPKQQPAAKQRKGRRH